MHIPFKDHPKEVIFTSNIFLFGAIPFLIFYLLYYLTKNNLFLDIGFFIFGISTIISGLWEIKTGYHVTLGGYFLFHKEEFYGTSVLKAKNKYRKIIEGIITFVVGLFFTVASFLDFLINSI